MAVLYAREGADVTIVYLPEEEQDAKDTKGLVENEGRQCILVAGNLMDNETCKSAVQQHMKKSVPQQYSLMFKNVLTKFHIW